MGWVSLATTSSTRVVPLTFRVRWRRVLRTLSPFPLPFPHPLSSRPSRPEAKMAAVAPGAASAELVIGWCIFGLLLLVGEALGVFPVLRLVGDRKGPALQLVSPARETLLAPPRPLLAWTMGSSSSPGTGVVLRLAGRRRGFLAAFVVFFLMTCNIAGFLSRNSCFHP